MVDAPTNTKQTLESSEGCTEKLPDVQPVFGTVNLLTEYQSNQQQTHACHAGQIPELLGPFQVPEAPPHGQEHANAQDHRQKLLLDFSGGNGGQGRHAHGAEEKGQGLHLKRRTADAEIENKQHPFRHRQARKAPENLRGVACPAEQESHHAAKLKDGQNQEIGHAAGRGGRRGPQLRKPRLLPGGNGQQVHVNAADGDGILRFQGADADPLAVDIHPVLGGGVGHGPTAVIVAGKYAVVPGDCGKIHHHIAALAAAHHVFPVSQRQLLVSGQTQPCPDFRLPPEGQQRLGAAQQQQKGKHRRRHPQKTDKHIIGLRVRLGEPIEERIHFVPSCGLFFRKGAQQRNFLLIPRQFVGRFQNHGLTLELRVGNDLPEGLRAQAPLADLLVPVLMGPPWDSWNRSGGGHRAGPGR